MTGELELLEGALRTASCELVRAIESGLVIEARRKHDGTLVLNVDLQMEVRIREMLEPEFEVLSEEDVSTHSVLEKSKEFLLIDPIDGTSACRRFLRERGGQVGFGPMVGLARDGQIVASVYCNIPTRTMYSAELGSGAHAESFDGEASDETRSRRRSLLCEDNKQLSDAVLLFYTGRKGEIPFVGALRAHHLIDNAYRFGGFANDCTRIAEGKEDLLIQFSLGAWDLPAALIAKEAGNSVILDPLGQPQSLEAWGVRKENRVLLGRPSLITKLQTKISELELG